MQVVTTVGLDIAKSVLQVHGVVPLSALIFRLEFSVRFPWLGGGREVDERRACGVLRFDPKSHHYRSRRPGQAPLEKRIKDICQTCVRYGYRRVHVMLRREGWVINEKKTRRVYNEMGMQLRSNAEAPREGGFAC